MYFSIVFGELILKTIGMNNTEPIVLLVAPFPKYFTKMGYPVVKVLSFSTKRILKLIGIKNAGDKPLTEEELRRSL